MKNITIVVIDGVFDSALALVFDVLRIARRVGKQRDLPCPYDVRLCSFTGDDVVSGAGLSIGVDSAVPEPTDEGVIVVPGFLASCAEEVEAYLERPRTRRLLDWLGSTAAADFEFAAGCTGTFLLAEAGLLEGRSATTTWWLMDLFCRRYPGVRVEVDEMVVEDARVVTSGAVMSHMDLALKLVERMSGPTLSDAVAQLLLLDGRVSQTRFMATEFLCRRDASVVRAESWIRRHIDEPIGVENVATAVGVSARTLSRRILRASGTTPLKLIQRIRVERAVHLLQTTDLSIERIAERVGYRDPSAFRRVFRRETRRAPSAYRHK